MTVERVKFVSKNDRDAEFSNSKRNTILFELNDGWNDYRIKTAFDVYYKDDTNKKMFIGNVKMACLSEGEDIINEIYNKYLSYSNKISTGKNYGISTNDLKMFIGDSFEVFCSVGKDLEYYQKLRKLFDNDDEFNNFLGELGDMIRNVDLDVDEKLHNVIEKSLFRYTYAKDLYEISKFLCEYNIKGAYGYEEENFDKLLAPLVKEDSSTSESYDKLKKILSTNKYKSDIADKIIESLEQDGSLLDNAQVQKLLNYIASDNDFGKEVSRRAGILCNDSSVLNKIATLEQLLNVDNIDDIELGHYTSLKTLPLLIKKDSEEKPPTIRLTNSSQMNDPTEGKILSKYIFEDEDRDYKTPNTYISSATTALDSLPMWKQYADDCQGAVMVYDKEFLKKMLGIPDNKLYKVCYINTDKEELEVEISGGDIEKEKVRNALVDLKESIDKSLEDDEVGKVEDRIAKYLSGIEYLFKDMDYSYEEEYRIVRDLKPESSEIVAEQSGDMPVPLLYTYLRGNDSDYLPVSYSKVQLGPKAIDIDYVEPYIRFASNGATEIIKSNVNFRD